MPSRPTISSKRRRLVAGLMLGWCARPAWSEEAPRRRLHMVLMQVPLAGSQFHALPQVIGELRTGTRLTLVREADNRHDPFAIRVEWQGQRLGYVPRQHVEALAKAMDRGLQLSARVAALRDDPDPWKRVELLILADL